MTDIVPVSRTAEMLVAELRHLITEARRQAAAAVNSALTRLCWKIGDRIRHNILGLEQAIRRANSRHAVARIGKDFGRGFDGTT